MRTLLERTYTTPRGTRETALVTAPNGFEVRMFVTDDTGQTVMDTTIPAYLWYKHRQMYVEQFSGR